MLRHPLLDSVLDQIPHFPEPGELFFRAIITSDRRIKNHPPGGLTCPPNLRDTTGIYIWHCLVIVKGVSDGDFRSLHSRGKNDSPGRSVDLPITAPIGFSSGTRTDHSSRASGTSGACRAVEPKQSLSTIGIAASDFPVFCIWRFVGLFTIYPKLWQPVCSDALHPSVLALTR
jgi:hypothetical protein